MSEYEQPTEFDLGRSPGEDPLRLAQAAALRAETESGTVAGLTQILLRTVTSMTAVQDGQLSSLHERWQRREAELLAREAALHKRLADREAELIAQNAKQLDEMQAANVRLVEANEKLHQRLNESITSTSQNFSDMATLPAIVADHGKQLLEAQSEHLEKMRKPLEPRPSGAETAGDAFKHLATMLREVAGDVFSSNPELRKRAARFLGGAIEKGEAVLGAGSTPEPEMAAPPADPVAAEARLDETPLKEVFAIFQGLPGEVIAQFCSEVGVAEPFAASWLQMRRLLASRSAK